MAFKQPQSTQAIPETEAEKVIQERIKVLQERLDAMAIEAALVEETEKVISELQIQKDKLASAVVGLEERKKENQEKLNEISASTPKAQTELDAINKDKKQKEAAVEKLDMQILKLEEKGKVLQDENKVLRVNKKSGDSEVEKLAQSIETSTKELINITNELAETKEELATFVVQKTELDNIKIEHAKSKAELKSSLNALARAKQAIAFAKEMAVEEFGKGKRRADQIVVEAQENMRRRALLLDSREGNLTRREAYVEDKVKKLSVYKLHVEKATGKQLKDFIIK